jgi:hypothetical protein
VGSACAPTWIRRVGGEVQSVAVFEAPTGIAGLDDVAMVRQPIEHGGGHLGVAEHLGPIGEGQIGGDQQRRVFVELADQVEQQLAARLTEWQIAEFIDDDEIVAQQLLGETAAAAGRLLLLQLIDQVDQVEAAGKRICAGRNPDPSEHNYQALIPALLGRDNPEAERKDVRLFVTAG